MLFFATDMEFFHLLNRGVEKKDVVLDEGDRMRFVRSLYTFNDINLAPNGFTQKAEWEDLHRPREPLVHIHAWCLMKNHYHLLVSPADDDIKNISYFMKKLNMGYAKFFNEKYERTGYLWQGKYKKIHVANDSQFLYIPYYIHLNPLDYTHPNWRTGQVTDVQASLKALSEYRWSSFLDYNQEHNFPSLLDMSILKETLGKQHTQLTEIHRIISGNSSEHTFSSGLLEA